LSIPLTIFLPLMLLIYLLFIRITVHGQLTKSKLTVTQTDTGMPAITAYLPRIPINKTKMVMV